MFQLLDYSQHGIILKMAKSGSVNKVGASIVGGIYLLRIQNVVLIIQKKKCRIILGWFVAIPFLPDQK
jgi:hypothetical protein